MCDLQLRKVITFSSELRFGCPWDFMESPLSQISSRTPLEDIGCLSRPEMAVRASEGRAARVRQFSQGYDLQLRKVITLSSEFRYGCPWTSWKAH